MRRRLLRDVEAADYGGASGRRLNHCGCTLRFRSETQEPQRQEQGKGVSRLRMYVRGCSENTSCVKTKKSNKGCRCLLEGLYHPIFSSNVVCHLSRLTGLPPYSGRQRSPLGELGDVFPESCNS